MRPAIRVLNEERFKKVLKEYSKEQARRFSNAIKRATLLIQRESMQIVPVDLGPLRRSAGHKFEGSGYKIIGSVFYTAAYAVYVHEIVSALHGSAYNAAYIRELKGHEGEGRKRGKGGRFLRKKTIYVWSDKALEKGYDKDPVTKKKKKARLRKPDEQSKFLEKPVRDNEKRIVQEIIKEMKL